MQTDLLGGVAVLIRPLVTDLAGQIYDANILAERMASAYGMSLPASALEDFTSRLVAAGILRKEEVGGGLTRAVYAEVALENETDALDVTLFQGIIDDFVAHAKGRLSTAGKEIPAEQLVSGFLRRLSTLDFSSIKAKPIVSDEHSRATLLGPAAREARAVSEQLSDDAALDALVGSYVIALQSKNPDWLRTLSEVADGALGLELVLDLQAPTSVPRLINTTAIIDTPILLSYLDLSSTQQHLAAKALIERLSQSGAKIAAFQHSIEEAESILYAIETARHSGEAYGPTVARMSNSTYRAFFETMRGKIAWAWQNTHKFELVQETATQFYKNFTEGDEAELMSRIRVSIVDRILTSERDAKSVAETMRRLGGAHIPVGNVASCKFVFITGNGGLQQRSARFLRERGFVKAGEFCPILTDRYAAGLCWLISGGRSQNSPSTAQLLANCATALRSKRELIARTKQFLQDLDATKAQHFEALMTNERASQYLVEFTLGNLDVITANNVEDIFAEAQRRAAETVSKERDEYYGPQVAALTAQIVEGESRAESLQEQISAIALESAAKDLRTNELQAKSERLVAALDAQREEVHRQSFELNAVRQSVSEISTVAQQALSDNEQRKNAAISFAERYANTRVFVFRVAGVVGFVLFSLLLGLLDKFYIPTLSIAAQSTANALLIFVQVLFAATGLSLLFDRLVGVPLQKWRDKLYVEKLLELGYTAPELPARLW
jgi:hypothetical protein